MTFTTDDEIRQTVRSIVLEIAPTQLDPAAVEAGTVDVAQLNLAGDLGYHSLALLEVIVALEEELQMERFDDSGTMFIRTLGDLEGYVVKLVREGAPDPV
jgi:acyl carrier protein